MENFNSTLGLAQDLVPADNFQYIQLENETRRYLCLQQNFLVLLDHFRKPRALHGDEWNPF